MSDFDEEAERERLRERFEREEKKREATEKMSELLLKGATMTNAHCSECGDPVFRYDGQEFCATCERPVERAGADSEAEDGEDQAGDDEASEGDEDAPANVEVTTPSDDARVKFGGDADEEEAGTSEENGADTAPEPTTPAAESDAPTASEDDVDVGEQTRASPQQPTAAAPSDTVVANVASAREDLAATLARFARAARESDAPAAAREHLATAREAAAALDELD